MRRFTIDSIELVNFAAYIGRQKLDLRHDSDKNLVVFNFNNGFGKTSFYHAIRWVFYGEKVTYHKDGDQIKTRDLINTDAVAQGNGCEVRLFLTYDDDKYEVQRTLKPNANKSVVQIIKNGRILSEEDGEEELSSIVPDNFADFFMFDGERLSHFVSKQRELAMEESVLQLLGLKQLKVLKEDLESIKKRYEREILDYGSTSDEVQSKQGTIALIDKEIQNIDDRVRSFEKDNFELETTLEESKEMRKPYEDLHETLANIDELRKGKNYLKEKILEQNSDLKVNSKNLMVEILRPAMESRIEQIDERLMELQGLSEVGGFDDRLYELKESIIKYGLKDCPVCNQNIQTSTVNEIKEDIEALVEKYERYKLNADEINILRFEKSIYSERLEDSNFDYQKVIDAIHILDEKMSELDNEIERLEEESRGCKYGELADLNEIISTLEKNIQDNHRQIADLKDKRKRWVKEKENELRAIKTLGFDDSIFSSKNNALEYVNQLIEKLQQCLDEGTRTKRNGILRHSNEVFMKMTNKPEEYKGLVYESENSFAYVIQRKDGRIVLNPSKGEKQIVAMCFLIGLNLYAERNNPIIMDTALSSLDYTHAERFVKAISNIDNQVFFLAQPKELPQVIFQKMLPSVSKLFEADRVEGNTIVKEVEI